MKRKTTTMPTQGSLLVLGSALQRIPSFHAWGRCASSLALDVHSTPGTAHHRNILQGQVKPDKESSQASGGTPPLMKLTPCRRQVLEARGVSVVYQRSATAEYRRRSNPAHGISQKSAASFKPKGSVVASLSATERHRQQRRAERGVESREITRTNPSSLRLSFKDQIMEYENLMPIQTKKETPPVNVNTSGIVMAAGAASVLFFASTLVVV